MSAFTIKRIFQDEGASAYSLTRHILAQFPGIPVNTMTGGADERITTIDMGKETLYLQCYKGDFLKPCPGTREYICCGYQILNLAANCPLDCSYCILQSYFAHQPFLRVFVNLEERLADMMDFIESQPGQIFRIGTGEFTDSLALDPITCWSDMLLPRFSGLKNAVLELKTKTTRISRVLASRHRDRIILSWSLNGPGISSREEKGAASIRKRIEAAKQCQSEGFILGFHFDPLVPHPGWKDDYARTIEMLDREIDPRGIIWISMGSFRFMPPLKPIIRKRHPESAVLDGEFILGLDGKIRYFKPIRIELYDFMRQLLETWHRDLGLYLCMESDEVWRSSMGWSPGDSSGLREFLDRRVVKFFSTPPPK
ncbi:MAG: DNA photolyase [Deltaproteobacteria bacterium]|nr:DNA photolyase [Deltaproteobacteria bacterium]